MKKQPEITAKTRQKFVDALWELAEEKPIPKIAVSELAKRAGYNRSTFYEYFLDMDDLLSYVERYLLDDIKQKILRIMPENESLEKLFPVIFAAIDEKIYILIGPNGDPGFFRK
ncbi:MAG: TetR/AcrR family transcriptional regulator [Clostridiales bacterium]|nr:TetR/AcrR family transcriptional regulator [Clostridiales bacterium]